MKNNFVTQPYKFIQLLFVKPKYFKAWKIPLFCKFLVKRSTKILSISFSYDCVPYQAVDKGDNDKKNYRKT